MARTEDLFGQVAELFEGPAFEEGCCCDTITWHGAWKGPWKGLMPKLCELNKLNVATSAITFICKKLIPSKDLALFLASHHLPSIASW